MICPDDPTYYPLFDRNTRRLIFSKKINNHTATSNNSILSYIKSTPLNKIILQKLNEKCPKAVKKAVKMLEELNYSPNNDIEIIWENKSICDNNTFKWLGLDKMFTQFKPITSFGKKLIKTQFFNPTINRDEIERSQKLIEFILSRGEGFIERTRQFLKTTYIPDEKQSFKGIIHTAMLTSYLFRFLRSNFPDDPMLYQMMEEDEANQELLDILTREVNFDSIEKYEFEAYWFRHCDENFIEEWEGVQNHFEMLYHDIKRRLSPEVELDRKNQCFSDVKSRDLKNIPNHYVKKYTKTHKFFTIPELNELFTEETQCKDSIKSYCSNLCAMWPDFQTERMYNIIARLDTASSFALFIIQNDQTKWCKPEPSVKLLRITQGWHPLVEKCRGNDFKVQELVTVITGFNSAGKSTFLKMVGLCVYLNQIGMYVPATNCCIKLFENIYSRAGAEDDLSMGSSTFMKQVSEVSYIIRKEEMNNDLVLLDELGSNTNEQEGKALAISILNRLKCSGATTIVSTHFNIEDFQQHLQKISSLSITQEHNLLPYDDRHRSNGWLFCKTRGFVE